MKRWIAVLSAVLVLQATLAAALFLSKERYGTFVADEKMFALDARDADSVTIEGGDAESLVLKKDGAAWTLPSMNGFPADGDAVDRLLERLEGLVKGWPVATTSGAARRFKVADEDFERKITVSRKGNVMASLFAGSSPGLGKVHVRLPGEDEIYAVELNAYEMETEGEAWIDKSVLSLKTEDVAAVEFPNLTLVRREEGMAPGDLAEDEEVVKEEIDRVLDSIAGLKIRSVLGKEKKPEYIREKPALRYTVKLASGGSRDYVFSKPKGESYYVLKASAREEYFSIDTWAVDRIKEVKREELVRRKTDAEVQGAPGDPDSSVDAATAAQKREGS